MPNPLIEICLESLADVLAAEAGGADRVELCADLVEGGITPSLGTIRLAKARARIPVMVMIRPRGGDFLYTQTEFDVMLADIEACKQAGADGVVFGVLTANGVVDRERTARLVAAAKPMQVTFHRAFDMTRDAGESLETLIALGVDRVLTSGREASVPEGIATLRALVQQAGERILVMPGAGINERNIAEVARTTRAKELHFAAFGRRDSGMQYRNPKPYMGASAPPGEYELQSTDVEVVRRTIAALRGR
jgi:copper homeostasis protein